MIPKREKKREKVTRKSYMVKMVKVKILLTGVKNKMVKMVITQFLFLTEPLKVKILLTRVKNKRVITRPF